MKLNRRIITVMTSVLALFFVIVIYLTHFILFESSKYVNSQKYNARIVERESRVLRGTIYDRNGLALAKSHVVGNETELGEEDKKQIRNYPYGSLYAHTIGYKHNQYAKTGIEESFNKYLQKPQKSHSVKKQDNGDGLTVGTGANLNLTLDNGMTELAAKLMGNNAGSVVAINPKTGEVYCLYSNPTFNPGEDALSENWESLNKNENMPLYFRATQGMYPTGSSFKIITATAAIESGFGGYSTNDTGKTNVGGRTFKNAGGSSYGHVDMRRAIAKSSNVYFTEISQKVGNAKLEEVAEKFYITKKIPFDIEVNARELDFDEFDGVELASTAIGQGKLMVSPFNMAVATCGIANNGVIMKPYMVKEAFYDNGEVIYEATPETLSVATDSSTANLVKEYMIGCVTSGTGTAARVSGLEVAGKTGTAENEKKGKTHAWFVGIAPAHNPQMVICVMKEYSGSGGGSVCAPIASKIFNYALQHGIITR